MKKDHCKFNTIFQVPAMGSFSPALHAASIQNPQVYHCGFWAAIQVFVQQSRAHAEADIFCERQPTTIGDSSRRFVDAMSPSVPGLQGDSHVICDQAAFSLIIEAKNFSPTFAVLHSLKESLERSGTRLVPAIAQKDGVQVGRPEPFSVWLRNGTEQTNDLDQK